MKKRSKEDTQFKKGNPGGPGRPVGFVSIKHRLQKYLDEEILADNPLPGCAQQEKYTGHDLIALKLMRSAIIDGDIKAIKEIYDRLEGKPQQTVKSANFNVDIHSIKQMSDEELEEVQQTIMKNIEEE